MLDWLRNMTSVGIFSVDFGWFAYQGTLVIQNWYVCAKRVLAVFDPLEVSTWF